MAGSDPQTSPDAFRLEQFGGMLPAWDDSLIPDNQAAYSRNAYLFSGALAGWRKPKLLHTLTNSAAKFAYRLPRQTKAIATATLYVHLNPAAGETFTLGEEIYTFVSGTPAHSYEVKIGATTAATATNIYNAVTLDDGANTNAGVTYGTSTVANPAVDQTSPHTTNILATDTPRVQFFAPSAGAAFNATIVGNTGTNLEWVYNNATTTHFDGGANLTFDASITGDSVWLEFVDPDTDVMRSPVVDDSFDRYYFASPSLAPRYNTRARIEAGLDHWLLGVPAPGCAPGLTVIGGGDSAIAGKNAATPTGFSAGAAPGANIIYLVPYTPDGALILNDVTLVPFSTSSTANLAAVLYGDLNGTPHELLNVGIPVQGVTAGTPVSSLFQNPTGLLQNVQYWLGFMTDTAFQVQQANATGSSGVVSLNTYSNGPPAVINSLTTGYPELIVYGNATSSALQEARAYVYTYETEYGEESPPSPATTLTGWSNGTWTVDLFTPPPDQMGVTRNIKKTKIYRTVTAQAGATTYFFVAEQDVTLPNYVDTIGDDVIVANNQLQSQLWTPPPENLQGIIAMPNGIAVGWRENEIWFSEPYRPHAWPASYVLTTEYPIVGLGVTGYSVVAATSGAPYVASGTSPGSMTAVKVQNSEPCNSRGSVLGNNDGVYYTSPNGLILVTQYGAVTNTSELWITRERWRQLTPPKNLRAVFLVSGYYALGTVRNGDNTYAQQGFTIELNGADAQSFSIWPQPGGHRLGFQLLGGPNDVDVDNVRIDQWSSTCLLVQNGGVWYFDFEDQAPVSQTYKWRSKLFQQKSRKNFAAMRISFSIPAGTPALNATRLEAATDDPVWTTLPADRYGFIRVYAGGRLVTVREIRSFQEILRIASGFKYELWQWEIEARVPIQNVQIGTSVQAMARI